MTRLYLKGDRVRLTAEAAAKVAPLLAKRHSPRGLLGTVAFDQTEGQKVGVLWDGLKSAACIYYSPELLERVE